MNKARLACVLIGLTGSLATADPYDEAFERTGDAEARSYFKERLSEDRDDHRALYYLGRLSLREQDFDDAIDHLDDAIDEYDEDYRYHYWYAMAHIAVVGQVNIFKQGIYAGRIRESLERAVSLKPDHVESLQGLFGFYLSAPGIAGGDVDKARDMADQIAGVNASKGWEARAALLLREEKPDEALAAYALAVETAPEDPEVRYRYAAFLIGRDRVDEGVVQIDQALPLAEPLDEPRLGWMLRYQLGKAAAVSGRHLERGTQALEGYLQIEPDQGMPGHDWARFRLAQIQAHGGAAEPFRTALRAIRKNTDDDQLKDQIDAALEAASDPAS